MPCVAVGGSIWIVSSWTGRYPREQNVDKIYLYDTTQDRWFTREGLPEGRRRGAGAAVYYNGEIYLSHGNRGGHGDHAKALGWLDKYNILEDRWIMNLTDAPNPRDHTGGVLIGDSRMFCVAGGRNSGVKEFFNEVVLPTDCYDLLTNTWEVRAKIPQGRAGANYGQTCDGKLMIAGGEGFGEAFNNVDVFDGFAWESFPSLVLGRHGSGLVFSCACGQVHVASGSIKQGAFETDSVESLFAEGRAVNCTRHINVVSSSYKEGDKRLMLPLVSLLSIAFGIFAKTNKRIRTSFFRRTSEKSRS
eukprot:CCRYP_019107-RA/>CCRYP_019107-RA protein AED:0.17 eAED:0.17 QI:0/-1/0/1/-1/1/1/0/302